MCKNEQSIHYCTILSAGQWDFLLDGKAAINRQKCLHRLMTAAVRTKAVLRIKGVEIALEVGQAAASDVELAEYMGCNRKTIGKLIDSFNRLGVLTTRTNNRTSVHTLHFLTGWYVDGVLLTNPIMSSQRLFPKDSQAECGHHTLMICRRRISRVPCRTVANAQDRMRTAWQAE